MQVKEMIICPNCSNKLNKYNNTYKCSNNHSFDIAKEGYLNLLLNKPRAGDNQSMIKARKEFLEKGYFDPLLKSLIDSINNLNLNNPNIVDIGCADGYYTNAISANYPSIMGFDISKDAIRYAAKKYKYIQFIVANAKSLPLKDESIDIILNIFAPHFIDEYSRILSSGGYIIKVTPNENHLIELKEVLYEKTYLTKEKLITEENYSIINILDLTYERNIPSSDLVNLFSMTPYVYKTPLDDVEKLKQIPNLLVTFDFNISIYKKHSNR